MLGIQWWLSSDLWLSISSSKYIVHFRYVYTYNYDKITLFIQEMFICCVLENYNKEERPREKDTDLNLKKFIVW